VLECWRKEYRKVFVLVHDADDFYFTAEGWSDGDIERARAVGFRVIERTVHRMRVTQVAGGVVLSDEYPQLAFQDFHIVPVYAKKIREDFWGKVRAAIDVQKEINKRHSQMVDILNKAAAYGWFVDGQTFRTPLDEENFKKSSSSPGFVARVRDLSRVPAKVDGVRFPAEIVRLEELATQKLRDIMNIPQELSGSSARDLSGIAITRLQNQGMMGNEFLYDQLNHAKQKLGRILVTLIQDLYTPGRILRVVANQNARERGQMEIAGAPFDAMMQEELYQFLETEDLTRYDIAISESAYNASNKQANFAMLADLARHGVPVPPALLLEMSDLPAEIKAKAKKELASITQEPVAPVIT